MVIKVEPRIQHSQAGGSYNLCVVYTPLASCSYTFIFALGEDSREFAGCQPQILGTRDPTQTPHSIITQPVDAGKSLVAKLPRLSFWDVLRVSTVKERAGWLPFEAGTLRYSASGRFITSQAHSSEVELQDF